tara:strand:+ start:543 stop:1526 length:984 start_codon:yes stop_codon:yes gene_type:complete
MKNFFKTVLKIEKKKIGEKYPVFIIAEAGVNHNGSLRKAYKLIDIAKKAGADAVKFQTFNTKESTIKKLKKAKYQRKKKDDSETQYEMLEKLELNFDYHLKIKNYCKRKKIIFFSTPSDIESLKLLKKLNVDCYKISSVDLNNFDLIEEVSKTNKPVIISTGMSNLEDVVETKKKLINLKYKKVIFLHCISSYPTKERDLNLNSIKFLKEKINSIIGFSDHTLGNNGAILAVACGAKVIEKHITINKKLHGPDHKISMDPKEFKLYVNMIRKTEIILGKSGKKIKNILNSLFDVSNNDWLKKKSNYKNLFLFDKDNKKFQNILYSIK